MSRDSALDRYFEEAASWDADRAALSFRSMRLAWRVAIGACVLAAMAILALVMLMPLKRVDPFVIRVDNATGIVDVVPTLVGRADMSEVVTRYFLTHYVTVCERFSFATAESDYEECGAFHAAARNQAWLALWDRANPASPLNAFKDGSSVRAQVSAVSFFERGNGVADLAQVRYTKARRASSSANDQVTHWIATVQYVYGEPSKDPLARRWNPLGFKIVDFRSEPETLPIDAPAATTAISSAGRAQ
ncbi:MAG: type IV secretion system protein [Steroidobacteraceae bacterium]